MLAIFNPDAYGSPGHRVKKTEPVTDLSPASAADTKTTQNVSPAAPERSARSDLTTTPTRASKEEGAAGRQSKSAFAGDIYDSKFSPRNAQTSAGSPRDAPQRTNPEGDKATWTTVQDQVREPINSVRAVDSLVIARSGPISPASANPGPYQLPLPTSIILTSSTASGTLVLPLIASQELTDHSKIPSTARNPTQGAESLGMVHSNHSGPHVSSIIPLDIQNGKQLSPQEMLQQASQKRLKEMKSKARTKDKESTTSLKDLDIARKPVPGAVYKQSPQSRISNSQPQLSTHGPSTAVASDRPAKKKSSSSKQKDKSRAQVTKGLSTAETPEVIDAPADIVLKDASDNDSNAWGSSIPSDASGVSIDSVKPLHNGTLAHHELAGWDGKIRPPPAEWHARSRFNYNSPEFHDNFARWKDEVDDLHPYVSDRGFAPLPYPYIEDVEYHADGIWLVRRDTVVNQSLAHHYGYPDTKEVTKYVQPVRAEDFDDWGKIDMSVPENMSIKNETTEDLVSNWVKHTEERRKVIDAQVVRDQLAVQALQHSEPVVNTNRPILNIYLRPACKTDIPQMTDIYNWYIQNSPRPPETSCIEAEDMKGRLYDAISNKLPLIVAVENNKRAVVPHDLEPETQGVAGDSHPSRNGASVCRVMTSKEKIVGWSSAQDLTASDYVERISVELEIYVDPACRQLGIGRCLMDQMLEACDRGYNKRGGYSFHCPQEMRHLYNSGGGRDLHKVILVVRKWKHPKLNARETAVSNGIKKPKKRQSRGTKPEDMENDYDVWLKSWLESWGFEIEGILKGIGAKKGRFVDQVLFGRETRWQPAEGRIPDPLPGGL